MESKRIFKYSLFIGSYRGWNFVNIRRNSAVLHKFDQIFINFAKQFKTVICSVNDFISKGRAASQHCSMQVFWLNFLQKFSKFIFFCQKNDFFQPTCFIFARSKLQPCSFMLKKELTVLPLTLRVFYNCNFDFFCKFKLDNYTKSVIYFWKPEKLCIELFYFATNWTIHQWKNV